MSFLPARQRAGQPEGPARAAPSGDDEPCRESRQRNGGGGILRDDVAVHRLTSARRTDGSASRRPGCGPVPTACVRGLNVGQPADLLTIR
jgi:hypothetical protein